MSSAQTAGWLRAALTAASDTGQVNVEGTTIQYRAWGPRDTSGAVLIHGGAAHARWWDHIGAMLGAEYRTVALDLSGHGGSGRRREYTFDTWAAEVLAAGAHGGIGGKPVLVGHSMGGFVALIAGTRHGDRLAGVVTVDSPVTEMSPEEAAAESRQAFGPLNVYESAEAALDRFRLIPECHCAADDLIHHIALHSVARVPGGWSWKFDPQIFSRTRLLPSELFRISCPFVALRGEYGLVTPGMSKIIRERTGQLTSVIDIPEAGHQVLLDQPLALVAAVRILLAEWTGATFDGHP